MFQEEYRFKKFPVYQDAKKLHSLVLRYFCRLDREQVYLIDQIRRASLSIALNIAEGSGKSSDKDFNRYLNNAFGSTYEVAAILDIVKDERLIPESQIEELEILLTGIRKQLKGFSTTLKPEN